MENYDKLFNDVPLEDDTRIISSDYILIEGNPVLVQQWVWDGIIAKSAIILTEMVKDLTESEILDLLSSKLNIDGKYTIVKSSNPKFTFVNFDFVIG